jgi:tRNA(fMet)-specific endonuclease VapC
MLDLDTDLLSLIQVGRGAAFQRLQRRLQEVAHLEAIAVTIISFEEQTRGWLAQIARARNAKKEIAAYSRLRNLLVDYSVHLVVDYDEAAAIQFDNLRSAKVRIGTMDLKIAAIVLSQKAKLLSGNLQDFTKVPGLSVENWSD